MCVMAQLSSLMEMSALNVSNIADGRFTMESINSHSTCPVCPILLWLGEHELKTLCISAQMPKHTLSFEQPASANW